MIGKISKWPLNFIFRYSTVVKHTEYEYNTKIKTATPLIELDWSNAKMT